LSASVRGCLGTTRSFWTPLPDQDPLHKRGSRTLHLAAHRGLRRPLWSAPPPAPLVGQEGCQNQGALLGRGTGTGFALREAVRDSFPIARRRLLARCALATSFALLTSLRMTPRGIGAVPQFQSCTRRRTQGKRPGSCVFSCTSRAARGRVVPIISKTAHYPAIAGAFVRLVHLQK
jgi:hypothetical protein